MMVVRNLEVTHRVDGVVHEIDSNVKANMVVTEDIDNDVKVTKLLVEDLEDNVKEIEGVARSVDNGTQHPLSISMPIPVSHYPNIVAHEIKRLSLPDSPSFTLQG